MAIFNKLNELMFICAGDRTDIDTTLDTLGFILSYPRLCGFLPIKYERSTRKFVELTGKWYLVRYHVQLLCTCLHPISLVVSFYTNPAGRDDPDKVMHYHVVLPIILYALANYALTAWKRKEVVTIFNTFVKYYIRLADKTQMLKKHKKIRTYHKIFNLFLLSSVLSLIFATAAFTLYYAYQCHTHFLSPSIPICPHGAVVLTESLYLNSAYKAVLFLVQFCLTTVCACGPCINYVLAFIIFGTYQAAADLRRCKDVKKTDWLISFTHLELIGILINSGYSVWISVILCGLTVLTISFNLMVMLIPVGPILTLVGASLSFNSFSFALLGIVFAANIRIAMKEALWNQHQDLEGSDTFSRKSLKARRGTGFRIGGFATIDKTAVPGFAHLTFDLTISSLVGFSAAL